MRERGRSHRECGTVQHCSPVSGAQPTASKVLAKTITEHLVSSNANVGIAPSLCCRSQQPNESDTTMFLQQTRSRSNLSHVVNSNKFPLAAPSDMNTVTVVASRRDTCNGCHVIWQPIVVVPTWPSVAGALTPELDKARTRNKTGGASSAAPSKNRPRGAEVLRSCLLIVYDVQFGDQAALTFKPHHLGHVFHLH